ncbi:hypothetical protein Ppa06_63160 [Planomonospora parontospora subsp. parontospora]|uniref:Uncharacterized protein n=2 Tax=Planomonospora parontospora TaxID=58119 RepID=A0AA37BN33_9ACTN|nr:hypothetical protein GCM10010126_62980 [Planomonospora parontospora]GII12518.1 hypothetical protein Ppa06_63160 [Planomonospora parontospora subsp. parontospora]
MYEARLRPGDSAGYHRVAMSSRAFTEGTQGSGREVSFRYRDVVPTGCAPVGSGRRSVLLDAGERPVAAGADAYEAASDRADTAGVVATDASSPAAITPKHRLRPLPLREEPWPVAAAPSPAVRAGVPAPPYRPPVSVVSVT